MSVVTLLLLGIDSLVVSVAIAPLFTSRSTRVALALLFGVCDGAAILIGAALGFRFSGPLAGDVASAVLAAYGLYILIVARWGWRTLARWPGWVMPVLFSLDNLAYGIKMRNAGHDLGQEALLLAVSSALMSLFGFALGGMLATRTGGARSLVTGPLLIAAAAVALIS
jgi:putative Mn2+ efflux pump MntP